MSESAIQLDVALADRLRPTLDRLLADLATVHPIELVSDPVIAAAEVAVVAVGSTSTSTLFSAEVMRLVPRGATPFERGLAIGMALVLKTRPEAR